MANETQTDQAADFANCVRFYSYMYSISDIYVPEHSLQLSINYLSIYIYIYNSWLMYLCADGCLREINFWLGQHAYGWSE